MNLLLKKEARRAKIVSEAVAVVLRMSIICGAQRLYRTTMGKCLFSRRFFTT